MNNQTGRRDFLATLAAGSLASLPARGTPPATPAVTHPDYLFSDGLVYLGAATMGPCARATVDAVTRAMIEVESNPTAMGYGGPTLEAAERVREQAAALLGCTAAEMVVTRSTTDGINAVAQGLGLAPGQRVLITDQEHPGGRSAWEYLAQRGIGLDVVPIPIGENDAQAVVDRIARALTPATRVVSVSHVLSSTGFRMPVAQIARVARSRGALLVVDGAQSAGNVAVDVKQLGCHAYATSGHKWLMGPKGTGLLYLASELGDAIRPIQCYDSRAVYSHSSGVQNIAGLVGLGVAIEAARARGIAQIERYNMRLRDRLFEGVGRIAAATIVSAPPGHPGASPLLTFRIPDRLNSRAMQVQLLTRHRIQVKVVPTEWLNGLRLSPHVCNTDADIDRALEGLQQVLI